MIPVSLMGTMAITFFDTGSLSAADLGKALHTELIALGFDIEHDTE